MPATTAAESDVISITAVARLAGVSTETIRKWLAKDAFPRPMRVIAGGWRRWRRADVVAWLKATEA
jgi:predicted DNA-binding transcriptional regulator AlpA